MNKLLVLGAKPFFFPISFLFGFFSFSSSGISAQVHLPVSYSFDTPADTLLWTHYASDSTKTDPWQWGMPSGNYLDTAHSAPFAWVTNLSGNVVNHQFSYLESPEFDLSAMDTSWYLSFFQARHINSSSGVRLQYSTDQGQTWTRLNETGAKRRNWFYNYRGWTSSIYNTFQHSTHSLEFLQGNPSVKFRFYFTQNTNKEGWLIDSFEILEEYGDISAARRDSVTGISQQFTQIPLPYTFYHSSPFDNTVSSNVKFYFSNDQNLDLGDALIDSLNIGLQGNRTYHINRDITLPNGLKAGEYFVIYEFDTQNTYDEENEQNNIGYTRIVIDSTYELPFVSSFENSTQEWKVFGDGDRLAYWFKGPPNGFKMETARTGRNAWYQQPMNEDFYQYDNLESPYLDLSSSVNTNFCFWFRPFGERRQSGTYSYFKLHLPDLNPTDYLSFSRFGPNKVLIPYRPSRAWDCVCLDISEYDGNPYAKFRFLYDVRSTVWPWDYKHKTLSIDDVYIGPAKPDVSIDGAKQNLFSSTLSTSDTLFYDIYNSGLAQLPNTTTEFYWSNDSLLDSSDILLGSQAESSMSDTSFLKRRFIYTKPSLVSGTYYIIHKVDASDQVDEMREYDNEGYLKLYQDGPVSLPYSNDFETQVDGWYHDATLGKDQWVWGEAIGNDIMPFSGTKSWVSNDTGIVSQDSRMHLYTPIFDFTSINNPVMSFDLDLAEYFSDNRHGINVSYSTDGGRNWEVLDTTSFSFYHWYYFYQYERGTGTDEINWSIYYPNMLYSSRERVLGHKENYESRDGNRNDMHVLDIAFLAGKEAVQFRFNYFNEDRVSDGVLIDNFQILDKYTDLLVEERKFLSNSSLTDHLRFSMDIRNDGNYLADSSSVAFYLSQDTLLDPSDHLLGIKDIDMIRPKMKHFMNLAFDNISSPLSQYAYLIYEIDPDQELTESDEVNNLGYWDLGMDVPANLPYFNDFEGDVIGDWIWYHEGNDNYQFDFRFRHKPVKHLAEHFSRYSDWDEGFWRLDFTSSLLQARTIPMYFLETPLFDFTQEDSLFVKFQYAFSHTVNNMDYSIDGGETWQVLGDQVVYDSLGIDWYTLGLSSQLGRQPHFYGNGGFLKVRTGIYNISFLSGESAVKFRFKSHYLDHGASWGAFPFYMDKFTILQSLRLEPDLVPHVNLSTIQVNKMDTSFSYAYTLTNHGCVQADSSNTLIYWSNDSILDVASDLLLFTLREADLNEFLSQERELDIIYPRPLTQQKYWLIIYSDAGQELQEIDETNNITQSCIDFSNTTNAINLNNLVDFDLSAYLEKQKLDVFVKGNSLKGPLLIELLDFQGRVVFKSDLTSAFTGKRSFMLNQPLSNSLYLLKVTDIALKAETTMKVIISPD